MKKIGAKFILNLIGIVIGFITSSIVYYLLWEFTKEPFEVLILAVFTVFILTFLGWWAYLESRWYRLMQEEYKERLLKSGYIKIRDEINNIGIRTQSRFVLSITDHKNIESVSKINEIIDFYVTI